MSNLGHYSNYYTHFYADYIRPILLKYLKSNNWDTFLDVGCGDGALLYAMKSANLISGKHIYGVDLSDIRIKRAITIDPSFLCVVDNAEMLDTIKDTSIDFLTAVNVIEHVDDEKAIHAFKRVLKPRAVVYISTTYKKWYGWYFYKNNNKWVLDPTHLREYTNDKHIFDILQDHGFEILETQKSISKYPILDGIFRLLHIDRYVYNNVLLKIVRNVSIPIIGYYKWEIICRKSQ